MAERLTKQQEMAVRDRGGKLLVSAAAGSGKTKVLVDRLLSYLEDPADPANLNDFLIITYTKAAAAELRGKIAAKLTERIAEFPENRHLQQQMQRLYLTKISTVHSFCADILREYAYRLDISPDFRVADENECIEVQHQAMESVLNEAYERAGDDPVFCAFVDTQGLGRDDRLIPEILLKVYNSAKCHLKPNGWLDWCLDAFKTEEVTDAGETIWGRYLIDDLHSYLDMQVAALKACICKALDTDEMEKPVVLLKDTVVQLERLRASNCWDDIVRYRQIDYGRLVFSKKCTDQLLIERIKAVRGACKSGLDKKLRSFSDDSSQVLLDLGHARTAAEGLINLVKQFEEEYERRKKARKMLDFGDLEHKMLDLLIGKGRTGPTSLAYEIGERFREVMVDEYQDSNEVQDAIFHALTLKKQNCFMVGDVKQSIYQFRLADPGIFLDKYNQYIYAEEAKPGEGRKILLSKNFRSGNGVMSAVNDVFTCCMSKGVGGLEYGDDEQLREGVPHQALPDSEIELYALQVQQDTYAEESAFVADRILHLLDGKHMVRDKESLRPIIPDDIVILLRSPGSVGAEFCYALEQRGIRCTMGGGGDLLQTEEISVLRSILQIISNPLQDIPLIAALSSRVFAFTADELAQIRGNKRRGSYYKAVKQSCLDKAVKFVDDLAYLRKAARIYNLPQLIQQIFLKTRMDSIFASLPDGEQKIENLHAFCQFAANYESSGRRDLERFLDHLSVLEKKGLNSGSEQRVPGAVTVMSIHKSKGLEFPVVFLSGLSRGFNHESSKAQVLCDKTLGIGLSCVDADKRVRYPTIAKKAIACKMVSDSISEEMRVLYVAMTRPKDRLIMTYAEKNLENEIRDIALRIDLSGKQLMTSDVDCPGSWVLQTAIRRTEAGALFEIGGQPEETAVHTPCWDIAVCQGKVDAVNTVAPITQRRDLPKHAPEMIKSGIAFSYAYTPATQIPSKQTATALKGRYKDQEASENCGEIKPIFRKFRMPAFVEENVSGIEHGNAMHAVMQYIQFSCCDDLDGVQVELNRLVNDKLISQKQAETVDAQKIVNLFKSEIGNLLRTSANVLREFKFSLLTEVTDIHPELKEERILLQGVVDCAIIEPDGITVIDFKTDKVTEQNLLQLVDQYKPQVLAYKDAMQRIYQTNVKAAYLYFFQLGEFVEITAT